MTPSTPSPGIDPPTDDPSTDEVLGTVDGGILTITFNRPHRLNAFTGNGYRRFAQLLRTGASDPDIAVAVVHGNGRAFSSGVDLSSFQDEPDALADAFALLLTELVSFPKPIIGAVHGYAIGFGMTMLLHFDLVIVAADARFRTPFVELGVAPEAASSFLLPRTIGRQHAAWMLMSGEWLDAPTAVALGLAWRQADRDVLGDAMGVARTLAAQPTAPLVVAKQLLVSGRRDAVLAALARERDSGLQRATEQPQ